MKIRLALDSEGEKIRDLLHTKIDLDWSAVYPNWLVCEKDGEIVGCLMVALAKPIGILDQLGLDENLGPHTRAKVLRELIRQGMATLRAAGVSATVSLIPFELKAYKRLLKKHFGAEVMNQGNVVMARL